jgi:hypothetical protein
MSFQEIGSLFDPVALSSNHGTYARLTLPDEFPILAPFVIPMHRPCVRMAW